MAKRDLFLITDKPFAKLGDAICSHSQHGLKRIKNGILFDRFRNGEVRVRVEKDVRNKEIILLKSFFVSPPSNKNTVHDPNTAYLELFLANDALKRAGARRIINVLPYIPYLRQDRVKFTGEPVSSRLFAHMTYYSGADLVITVDMHSKRNEQCYPRLIRLDPTRLFALYIMPQIMNALKKQERFIIIAPDQGAACRAKRIAQLIGVPYIVCKKERNKKSSIVSLQCPAIPPQRKHAIIYDDMIDTGGTLFQTIDALRNRGIKQVTVCCTHALLSGNAEQELKKRKIRLITTDSLPRKRKGITVLSLAEMLAKAIDSIKS